VLRVESNGLRKFNHFGEIAGFIWQIADLLRGDYKQADYGKVILPFTVLRRLDCVLEPTKAKVLARHEALKGGDIRNLDLVLGRVTGVPFHNISKLDFPRLLHDPSHIAANLTAYLRGFSENARDIFLQRFRLQDHITKLDEANLLFQVVQRFAEVDLHPRRAPSDRRQSQGDAGDELPAARRAL
jgi:type I restriction enzyme M protein